MSGYDPKAGQTPFAAAGTTAHHVPSGQYSTTGKSPAVAAALELIPGLCGIFGLGHLYAGQVATGVVLFVASFTIFPVIGGILTALTGGVAACFIYPLVVLGLIASPILAAKACR